MVPCERREAAGVDSRATSPSTGGDDKPVSLFCTWSHRLFSLQRASSSFYTLSTHLPTDETVGIGALGKAHTRSSPFQEEKTDRPACVGGGKKSRIPCSHFCPVVLTRLYGHRCRLTLAWHLNQQAQTLILSTNCPSSEKGKHCAIIPRLLPLNQVQNALLIQSQGKHNVSSHAGNRMANITVYTVIFCIPYVIIRVSIVQH